MICKKKNYQAPHLIRHGDVKTVTQQAGDGFVDVPCGDFSGGSS